MKLADYLLQNNISPIAFGKKIGVSSVSVNRYTAGTRRPRPKLMRAILKETDGAVSANDFFDGDLTAVAADTTAKVAA